MNIFQFNEQIEKSFHPESLKNLGNSAISSSKMVLSRRRRYFAEMSLHPLFIWSGVPAGHWNVDLFGGK